MVPLLGSCGQNETAFSGPHRTGTLPAPDRNSSEASFKSETDQFNPDSRFESIRKKRLTEFGYRDTKPFPYPRTKAGIQIAFNDSSIIDFGVLRFISGELVQPSFPFDYENDTARLEQLYEDHRLGTVVNRNMGDLQALGALMVYTNRFLEGGSVPEPGDDPGPSAELITKRKREQNIGGTSRHYAALFCQLALSCGYNARLVGLHSVDDAGTVHTHTVCEVFSNEFKTWGVFDPYLNATYYLRGKIPQSALELRDIMLDQNYRSIKAYSLAGDIASPADRKQNILPCYRYVYIWRMNDILSKSPRNGSISWQELYSTHLVWEDARSPIAEGRFDQVPAFNDTSDPRFPLNGVRFAAHTLSDFYWPLDYVILDAMPHPGNKVTFSYNVMMPNFKEFSISDNDESRVTKRSYELLLPENTMGTLYVSGINAFGKKGGQSYLDYIW